MRAVMLRKKLARALNHGMDVTAVSSAPQVVEDGFRPEDVAVTPRIGIRKAIDLPLRFVARF